MPDHIDGFLEVGVNDRGEVILNHPPARVGAGHIAFSPAQARALAEALTQNAATAEGVAAGRVPDARPMSTALQLQYLALGQMVAGMITEVHLALSTLGGAKAYGVRGVSFPGGVVKLFVATEQVAAVFQDAARRRFDVADVVPASKEIQ